MRVRPETYPRRQTDLNVLARDLYIIEFRMMELNQIAAPLVKGLTAGSDIEALLVRVTPVLQSLDVLAKLRHVLHEIFLDRSLWKY